jgi:glyoxylase-like metal-dependent hydrolase (beta-lactamase superfamily II)
MNRREFLRQSALFAAAGLLSRAVLRGENAAPTSPDASRAVPKPFGEFKPLRRNVGIFTGRGGTIGWLASPDALVVVDTQFPDTAASCLAGLPGRAGRKIDVVLNTHHHRDHTSGNGVFRPAAKTIVAQVNVPKLQFADVQRAEQDAKSDSRARLTDVVYADTTFTDAWRHEFPDEIVTAQYFGPAHTSGDAVIYFEKANVVHMGDLVFNRLYPVIDRAAGASARNWIKVLEEAMRTYPADAIYVYGHGSAKFGVTGTRDDLLVMRDYWSAVVAYVEKQIASGKSKGEIVGLENLPGFSDFHQPLPNRLGGNLGAVFDELTAPRA